MRRFEWDFEETKFPELQEEQARLEIVKEVV